MQFDYLRQTSIETLNIFDARILEELPEFTLKTFVISCVMWFIHILIPSVCGIYQPISGTFDIGPKSKIRRPPVMLDAQRRNACSLAFFD